MDTVWLLFMKPFFYLALQAFLSTFVLYRDMKYKKNAPYKSKRLEELVAGIIEGCRLSGCALVKTKN